MFSDYLPSTICTVCKLGSLYLMQSLIVITQYLPHRVSKFHENAVQLITDTTCEL